MHWSGGRWGLFAQPIKLKDVVFCFVGKRLSLRKIVYHYSHELGTVEAAK